MAAPASWEKDHEYLDLWEWQDIERHVQEVFEEDICEKRKVSGKLDRHRKFGGSFDSRLKWLSLFLSSICFLLNVNLWIEIKEKPLLIFLKLCGGCQAPHFLWYWYISQDDRRYDHHFKGLWSVISDFIFLHLVLSSDVLTYLLLTEILH